MSSSDSFGSLSQKLAYLDCETLKLRILQRLWSPSKFSWFWEIGQVTKLMQRENLPNLVPRLQSVAVDHEAWEQFLGLAEKRGRTGQGTAADWSSGEFSSQTWPQPPPPCFLPVSPCFPPFLNALPWSSLFFPFLCYLSISSSLCILILKLFLMRFLKKSSQGKSVFSKLKKIKLINFEFYFAQQNSSVEILKIET